MRPADPGEQQPEVPTVDRGFRLAPFWSIEIAGLRPSIWSTSGFSICPRNCRAYALRLST
jgi:hypothetical protein